MIARYAALLLTAVLFTTAQADHFAGGTVSARCVGGNFHEVTLQLFRNCSGTALLPQTLQFTNDCGVVFEVADLEPVSIEEVSPLCAADLPNSTCNGGSLLGYDLTTYRTMVFLSPCSLWNISWITCCRNPTLNVTGSPGLFISCSLNNIGGVCNAQPEFVNNTIPLVCLQQAVSHDASATDLDGNILSYALVSARYGAPDPQPVTYAAGYTGSQPFPGMVIDPSTGIITFVPTLVGAIIAVVEVTETNSTGAVTGTVMRDFLFIVSSCANTVPSTESGTFTESTGSTSITGERELEACGTNTFCASITISDANVDQQLSLATDAADVLAGAIVQTTGTNPIQLEICWSGATPGVYPFTITATDNSCPVVGSQTYNYTITVIPGGNSGIGSSETVCANESALALVDLLGGTPGLGGVWTDPNGSTNTGIFTPGTSIDGTYTYTVTGPIWCVASSTVEMTTVPISDPNCLTAWVPEAAAFTASLRCDPLSADRVWITTSKTGPMMVTMWTVDGRLLASNLFVVQAGNAAILNTPTGHAGAIIVDVQDQHSGARQVLRSVVY